MFSRRLSFCMRGAFLTAVLALAAASAICQEQQKLPDAPAPQNNAPAPSVALPPPSSADDQGNSSSSENPEPAGKYSSRRDNQRPGRPIRSLLLRDRGRSRPSRRAACPAARTAAMS